MTTNVLSTGADLRITFINMCCGSQHMFSLRNHKFSLNYPQYPLLSRALVIPRITELKHLPHQLGSKLKQEKHERVRKVIGHNPPVYY